MHELLRPRSLNRSGLAFLVGALALMSVLSVLMFLARVHNSGSWTYFFVPGNLLLAWMPLLCAIGAYMASVKTGSGSRALTVVCGASWLLFLPNAPYVLTDLQHYEDSALIAGWYDGLMLGSFVATGVLLGLVSLYVMHSVIARAVSDLASWLIIFGVMPLCGFGIYLGRVLRWNSWDALTAPGMMLTDLGRVVRDPLMRSEALSMTVGFGAFLAIAYVALYAVASVGVERPRA